jgi:ABC-2 type transport system permease protein
MTARVGPVAGMAARATASDPAGLVFTAAFYLLATGVLSTLWATAAESAGGSIAGYTTTALIWYIATSEATTIPLPARLVERLGDDIGSGRVEVELLRPVSPLWVRLANETGALLPRLGLCAAIGTVYALVMAGSPPSLAGLALAVPALVLATVANLVAQHAFAAAAFWLREARSAGFLYQKVVFVLGGMLLPLEVLPDQIETAARWLPFAAMAYVPARLASGHVEPQLLAVQVVWLVILALAAARVVTAGERRLVRGLA